MPVQEFSPIGLFIFLLLDFLSSLYILDKSFIDMSFAGIFSQSMSFHSLDIVFHKAEVFNFNEFQFVDYFFYGSFFWSCIDANPSLQGLCVVAAMDKFTWTTEILWRKRDGVATL